MKRQLEEQQLELELKRTIVFLANEITAKRLIKEKEIIGYVTSENGGGGYTEEIWSSPIYEPLIEPRLYAVEKAAETMRKLREQGYKIGYNKIHYYLRLWGYCYNDLPEVRMATGKALGYSRLRIILNEIRMLFSG